MPGAEVPQDLLCNLRVINHRDDAHRALTDGAAQRVNMQVSVLTIYTRARPPELAKAFGEARSGPRGS